MPLFLIDSVPHNCRLFNVIDLVTMIFVPRVVLNVYDPCLSASYRLE